MKNLILFSSILLFNQVALFAQCQSVSIVHFNGTQSYSNGLQVTVSSSGFVDSNSMYCPEAARYIVGFNAGEGVYTFEFSPPASALGLKVSRISNTSNNQEVMTLNVNGLHHNVLPITYPNGCDPLAIITTGGDITGCAGCVSSGCGNISIYNGVTSLSVKGGSISGSGDGMLFSLFACEPTTEILENQANYHFELFPNPFSTEATLHAGRQLNNATLILSNAFGQEIKRFQGISGTELKIPREGLHCGVYFLRIKENNKVILSTKLVVVD